MHLRALALISGAAALSTPRGAAKGLAVRGGGLDVEQIAAAPRGSRLSPSYCPRRHRRVGCTQATWVGLASSGFILLPAGRDIVAEGTAILPGDEELISALSIANPDAKRWFWGMWGLNHCFLSILKLQAINQKDKAMLKKLLIPTAATFLYCVLGQSDMGGAADLGGFIAVCGLQTLAIGYLAYN